MKWSIQQLRSFQRKGLEIDETIVLESIHDFEPEIREITPVHVTGSAEINQNRAVFHLKMSGEMTLPCSVTLQDVRYPFVLHSTEIFMFDPDHGMDANEEDIHLVEGNTVDLKPYIQENILLEKPLKVISSEPTDNPPAPPSGNGWEVVEEDPDQQDKVDPRMAGLAKLLNDNEKK
ncbi:YceD family protein [Pseudalkalibacillus berkeleyi]|uniref:YceD family protein n=1 Tax=Pseudalkalibacillus berkeleyi TaxID=1069813 RepID=A0ABS9GZC1_9BACL|nr:YceD family protein [Pseudalkalibacillus berkeleyi]MCF6136994.1 YceD family protein [Pseudalkalibacillus berkeleyi]